MKKLNIALSDYGKPHSPRYYPDVQRLAIKVTAILLAVSQAVISICAEPGPPQTKLLDMRMESSRTQFYRAIREHPEDYSAQQKELAEKELAEIEQDYRTAKSWTSPAPEFTLPRLPEAPVIDGWANEAVWRSARVWRGSFPCSSETHSDDGAVWRLAWHGGSLYGSVSFPDRDITFYQGRQGEPWTNKRIWQGDCLEVFIQPDEKIPYYIEFLLRPDDTAWALDHVLPESGFWTTIRFHFQAEVQLAGHVTDNGYELEFGIRLGSLDPRWRTKDPQNAESLRMTMVRMNLDVRQREKTVQTSFYPLLYSGHNIFGYAKMTFSDDPPLGGTFGRSSPLQGKTDCTSFPAALPIRR